MTIEIAKRENGNSHLSALGDWWKRFNNNTGTMARFRRCRTIDAVYLEPEFAVLLHAIQDRGGSPAMQDKLAAATMVLANVRRDANSASLGSQLGKQLSGAKSGQIRFRKLYEVKDDALEELAGHLMRFLRQLNGTANLTDLARAVLYWPNMRKQVAMDFFDSYKE